MGSAIAHLTYVIPIIPIIVVNYHHLCDWICVYSLLEHNNKLKRISSYKIITHGRPLSTLEAKVRPDGTLSLRRFSFNHFDRWFDIIRWTVFPRFLRWERLALGSVWLVSNWSSNIFNSSLTVWWLRHLNSGNRCLRCLNERFRRTGGSNNSRVNCWVVKNIRARHPTRSFDDEG
jgi:hypothetical protein